MDRLVRFDQSPVGSRCDPWVRILSLCCLSLRCLSLCCLSLCCISLCCISLCCISLCCLSLCCLSLCCLSLRYDLICMLRLTKVSAILGSGKWTATCDGSHCSSSIYAYVYPNSISDHKTYLCDPVFFNAPSGRARDSQPGYAVAH